MHSDHISLANYFKTPSNEISSMRSVRNRQKSQGGKDLDKSRFLTAEIGSEYGDSVLY